MKFDVANAGVVKARTKLAKAVTRLFVPLSRIDDRLAKPTRRCAGCGYLVQGACAVCRTEEEG